MVLGEELPYDDPLSYGEKDPEGDKPSQCIEERVALPPYWIGSDPEKNETKKRRS